MNTNMSTGEPAGLTITGSVHFARSGRGGRRELHAGPKPATMAPGRVPRVSRLMALAIRFERLVAEGVVKDHAELARLGHVTRARVSQIMALLHLAPDLQEKLLFLPVVQHGRDPIVLRDLLPFTNIASWAKQRRRFAGLASGG